MKKLITTTLMAIAVLTISAQNINVSGTISTNTTWDNASIDTVKITGNTYIDDNVTLTIEPGIVVDFTGNYLFEVNGNILATGTVSDSIVFTTSDTTGYATNSHHGWSGIRMYDQRYDTSRLEYCVIEYGKADGTHSSANQSTHGGGVYIHQSWRVYINNSSIRNNYASANGGGVYCYYGMVLNYDAGQYITNTNFINNYADLSGGGFYSERNFYLGFENCLFLGNACNMTNGSGGALTSTETSFSKINPDILNCRFGYNQAAGGGALYFYGTSAGDTKVHGCYFHNNSAVTGGAISARTVIDISNCVIVNNEASSHGGGMYLAECISAFAPANNKSEITNNTIAYNNATYGGGIAVWDRLSSYDVYIGKTIFYSNGSSDPTNDDIYLLGGLNFNNTTFYNCSFTTDITNTAETGVEYDCLHNTNPLFVSPSGGIGVGTDGYNGPDFRLSQCGSTCINYSTDHSSITQLIDSLDYTGNQRTMDGVTDIGAYETTVGWTEVAETNNWCSRYEASFNYQSTNGETSTWQYSTNGGSTWNDAGNAYAYVYSDSLLLSDDGVLVRLYDDFGCGIQYSPEAEIKVYETPVPVVSNDTSICRNDTVLITAKGGDTHFWGFTNGNLTFQEPYPVYDSVKITTDVNTLLYTAAINDYTILTCEWYDTVSVEVFNSPVFDASVFKDYTLCEKYDSVTVGVDSGYAYQWSSGSTEHEITVDTLGSHTLTVTDGFGCQQEFAFAVVPYNMTYDYKPGRQIDLGPDSTTCEGKGIYFNLYQSNMGNFLWSDGNTSSSRSIYESGVYFAEAYDYTYGCRTYDTVVLNFELNSTLSLPDSIGCEGAPLQYDVSDLAGVVWRDLDSNTIMDLDTAGTYVITAKNNVVSDPNYQCTQKDTVTIGFEMINVINLADSAICYGTTVTYSPNLYAHVWKNQSGNVVASTFDTSGIYMVEGRYNNPASDYYQCIQRDTVEVLVRPESAFDIGPDTFWACDQEVLTFDVLNNNGQISSYFVSNFFQTVNNGPLTFTYDRFAPPSGITAEGTDTNGCEVTDYILLLDNTIANLAMNFPSVNDPLVDFSTAFVPEYADNWWWDFGDGDTLAQTDFTQHEYTMNGDYEACLIAENECGKDSSCTSFSIFNAMQGINELQYAGIKIYPNPSVGKVMVELNEHSFIGSRSSIEVYNQTGMLVKKQLLTGNVTAVQLDLSDLENGMYYIRWNNTSSFYQEMVQLNR